MEALSPKRKVCRIDIVSRSKRFKDNYKIDTILINDDSRVKKGLSIIDSDENYFIHHRLMEDIVMELEKAGRMDLIEQINA